MSEKKYNGDCPECGAPCEVIETSYIEEGHEVHFVEHKYSQPGAVWVKTSDRLPGWGKQVKWRYAGKEPDRLGTPRTMLNTYASSFENWQWLDESPAEQPVADKQDWSNFIPQMSNIQDRTGISIEWQKVWAEVENWYGDIKKKETGEQFLKRIQATYFTEAAEQPGREVDAIAFAEWLNSNFVSIENKDGEAAYVEYSPQEYDKKQQFKISQLWEVFKKEK